MSLILSLLIASFASEPPPLKLRVDDILELQTVGLRDQIDEAVSIDSLVDRRNLWKRCTELEKKEIVSLINRRVPASEHFKAALGRLRIRTKTHIWGFDRYGIIEIEPFAEKPTLPKIPESEMPSSAYLRLAYVLRTADRRP